MAVLLHNRQVCSSSSSSMCKLRPAAVPARRPLPRRMLGSCCYRGNDYATCAYMLLTKKICIQHWHGWVNMVQQWHA